MSITAICLTIDKRIELFERLNQEAYDCEIKMIPFIAGDGSNPKLQYSWIDQPKPSNLQWNYFHPDWENNGIAQLTSHYNAFRCHQEMAKIGLKVLENDSRTKILFLEDDAKILVDRFNQHKKHIDCPCLNNKDIVYLGYWTGRENDIQIEEKYKDKFVLEKIERPIGGLHGAILGKRALEQIINMKPNDPVDAQLNRLSNITRFIVKPKIITTVNTFSFTERINIERDYI